MAVSFAVGVAALPVMVVLAVVMGAERLASWGQRLTRPVGAIVIGTGLAAILSVLPAGAFAA
jgi:predicted metal-binding membrane protein